MATEEELRAEHDAIAGLWPWSGDLQGKTLVQAVTDDMADYKMLIENTTKIVGEVTNWRLSKPNTAAHHVVAFVNERIEEAVQDARPCGYCGCAFEDHLEPNADSPVCMACDDFHGFVEFAGQKGLVDAANGVLNEWQDGADPKTLRRLMAVLESELLQPKLPLTNPQPTP